MEQARPNWSPTHTNITTFTNFPQRYYRVRYVP